MKYFGILMLLSVVLTTACSSADKSVVLNYDFKKVAGDVVKDASASGIDAVLKEGASVEKFGKVSVLKLGTEKAYLDMTEAAGKLLSSLDDFSVSVYYRTYINPRFPGYGYFVWTFSTEEACGPDSGRYFAYRINEQRAETSVGGYNHEQIIMKGEKSVTGKWVHVLYTQKDATGTLYIDGEKIGENKQMPLMKTNFADPTTCNWLGRPAFRGDNYLHDSYIADFRIYNVALGPEQIAKLAAKASDLPECNTAVMSAESE